MYLELGGSPALPTRVYPVGMTPSMASNRPVPTNQNVTSDWMQRLRPLFCFFPTVRGGPRPTTCDWGHRFLLAYAGDPRWITERKDVLPGADFVVLSFADRTVRFRGLDCQISAQYSVRMCSGDTIGPGGIFRAMREFPVILECARDIESLCPDAWVISYINPTTVHGIGLRRYAPNIKSFALCDSLHMPPTSTRSTTAP